MVANQLTRAKGLDGLKLTLLQDVPGLAGSGIQEQQQEAHLKILNVSNETSALVMLEVVVCSY